MLRLVLLLGLCGVAFAKIKWGPCPNIAVQKNFNVTRYMGTWYEFERYDVIFERGVKCGRADYAQLTPTTVRVHNSGTYVKDGTMSGVTGKATIPDPSEPAKLRVQFPTSFFAKGNYWVLASDYRSYSVVYSCTNLYLAHVDVVWVLSRRRSGLSRAITYRLHRLLTNAKLDAASLQRQVQTGCVN